MEERRRLPPLSAVGPVLLISVLVLLFFWYRPPARPVIAPPWAISDVVPFEWLPGTGGEKPTPVPVSGDIHQRDQVHVTTEEAIYSSEIQMGLVDDIESSMVYVSNRFGSGLTSPVQVYVGKEPNCNLNGLAYTDQRLVQVFTCSSLPSDRTVNILAHEFVHQLAHDRYGPPHLQADLILSEGVATWGAGKYWLGDAQSFTDFVRHYYGTSSDSLLPLNTSYVGRPVSDMNKLYYQWASFVEFLLDTYGREQFDALYVTGSNAPGSADYPGIYGKPLGVLEQEWKKWLKAS